MTESAARDRATSIGSSHLQTDPEEDVRWEAVRPRSLSLAQWDRFEGYVREIFEALGMDLETPGTKDTPSRFLRALLDSTDGYEGDPKLLRTFPTECRGGPDGRISQIVEGPISFFALCEHHALPFYGVAHIG
jgi:GTP cyclohydrolase IA